MCVISIFSDESGVFSADQDVFVFAGLIYLKPKNFKKARLRYAADEQALRGGAKSEFKAYRASLASQDKLIGTQKDEYKFAVVINQKELMEEIYLSSKVKQRYLDYAYRVAVGKCLKNLIDRKLVPGHPSNSIHLYLDDHSSAINQEYELRESLEQNLRYGSFGENWNQYRKPIFPTLTEVSVELLDSKKEPLIRAADMLANRILQMEKGQAI